MSHEPECPKNSQSRYPVETCPACTLLRAAYQRGREDAAKAVWSLDRYSHSKISDDWFCKIDDAVVAAIEGKPSAHLQESDAVARWKQTIATNRAAHGVSPSAEQADSGNGGEQS